MVTGKGGRSSRRRLRTMSGARGSAYSGAPFPCGSRCRSSVPFVLGYEEAARSHGGSGALYVRLRRRSVAGVRGTCIFADVCLHLCIAERRAYIIGPMDKFTKLTGGGGAAEGRQCRYRPDHSRAFLEDDQADGSRPGSLRTSSLSRGRLRKSRFRAQQSRPIAGRRSSSPRTISAAARRASTRHGHFSISGSDA